MENEEIKNKKGTPFWMIVIVFVLVTFIVAGTIICINSFNNRDEEDQNTLQIVNGTAIPKKRNRNYFKLNNML